MWGVIFWLKLNGKEGDCMANIKKKTSIPKVKDKINKPKTSSNISNVKHEALKTAGKLMREKYVQQRSRQADERPENYAEEQVENRAERTANAAADVSGQSVRYIRNKVNQYHAKNSINTQKSPVSENYVQEVGLEYTNAPKTPNVYSEKKETAQVKDGIKNRSSETAMKKERINSIIKSKENLQGKQKDTPKIKNRESMIAEQSKISYGTNIKIKDKNANKMNAFLKNKENAITEQLKISGGQNIKTKYENANRMNAFSDNRLKIKSKEEYIKNKEYLQTRKYRLKSEKVYRSKKNIVRPKTLKEVNLKQLELGMANGKDKAVKRYAQSKIKTKAETQKLLNGIDKSIEKTQVEKNPTREIYEVQDNIIHPKQRPDIGEKIKVKRADIKTKENYIKAHKKFEQSNNFIQSKTNSNDKNIIKKRFQPIIKSDKKGASILNKQNKTLSVGINKSRVNYYSKKVISRAEKRVKARATKQAVNKSKKMIQSSVRNIKRAVKASVKIAKAVKLAVTKTAKAVVSAIAALGGGMAVLIAVIVVVIIAAIAASPFGIFISNEVSDEGTIPLSQIIAEYNSELTQQIEEIENTIDYTEVEIIDNRADNNVVVAVFAAKTAGAEDDTAEDVVVFDEAKAEKLKNYFRDTNKVSYTTLTVETDDEVRTYLTIKITGKNKEQLMNYYALTTKQREAVETLLESSRDLTLATQSLAITDSEVRKIIEDLPSELSVERKAVVKNAGSLVGKVNYFWGGKSMVKGWDSSWGTMRTVTAEGSPTTGTIRTFGLDCSGFVTWVFNNSGMGYSVGNGTYGQKAASRLISRSEVHVGDLAFLADYSHVGIIAGKNDSGSILVIHCSSSANNVTVSTAELVGFTVFRRPNCL